MSRGCVVACVVFARVYIVCSVGPRPLANIIVWTEGKRRWREPSSVTAQHATRASRSRLFRAGVELLTLGMWFCVVLSAYAVRWLFHNGQSILPEQEAAPGQA